MGRLGAIYRYNECAVVSAGSVSFEMNEVLKSCLKGDNDFGSDVLNAC